MIGVKTENILIEGTVIYKIKFVLGFSSFPDILSSYKKDKSKLAHLEHRELRLEKEVDTIEIINTRGIDTRHISTVTSIYKDDWIKINNAILLYKKEEKLITVKEYWKLQEDTLPF